MDKNLNSKESIKHLEQLSFDELLSVDRATEKKREVVPRCSNYKNEKIPVNLVADFDEFTTYISQHAIQLTKTKGYISRKYLPAINDLMSVRNEDATPNTEQELYPYIHFLFHLAMKSQLVEKSTNSQLGETERLKLYWELTDVERYFFLLETFWVDMDWSKLQQMSYSSISLQLNQVFFLLNQQQVGKALNTRNPLTETEQMLRGIVYNWNYFLLYFEWMGLWICEEDLEQKKKRGIKSAYYARNITKTPFGEALIPILLVSRNIEAWNIAFRREGGEFNSVPGSRLESGLTFDLTDLIFDELKKNIGKNQSNQPFFKPFTDLFTKEELQKTLPRRQQKFTAGQYTFKVSFTQGSWRRVALSAVHTMSDLHTIILQAFQFDDDHLYSFFMDGRKWSNDCIASPDDDFGHPDASKIQIGDMGFIPRQTFLYLYDYGDEWAFTVEVERINEDDDRAIPPYVKESKGKAPDQYIDFY